MKKYTASFKMIRAVGDTFLSCDKSQWKVTAIHGMTRDGYQIATVVKV